MTLQQTQNSRFDPGSFFNDIRTSFRAFRELRAYHRQGNTHPAETMPAELVDEAIVEEVALPAELKERVDGENHPTRLDIHHEEENRYGIGQMFSHIMRVAKDSKKAPPYGTYQHRLWLDKLWRNDSILSGAMYSMVAKAESMNWRVDGGRNLAGQAAQMLASARHLSGNDWTGFISPSAIEFYSQNMGFVWDVTRQSYPYGRIDGLAAIDSKNCVLTGNAKYPMYYRSVVTNQEIWYQPWMFMRGCSMLRPDERWRGMSWCAVERAAKSALLLSALYDYDAEKLSNLPPEGVASVTGMTDAEFRAAIRLWMAERRKNNSLTFPQVLWLIGNNPNAKVAVNIQSFSQVPEQFDRQTVVTQYVQTLALCFGVDVREFWAISSGALGTASETEVQHLKARGKGGGEFIAIVERLLNAELPPSVFFTFDTADIEEDMVAANVAKAWIDAYIKLVFPPEGYDAIIDATSFKRLLADKGVLPEWMVGDNRISIESGEIHKDYFEDLVRFVFVAGKLNPTPYALDYGVKALKETNEKVDPNKPIIKGKPIAAGEVERGTGNIMPKSAVQEVYDFWDSVPEIAALVKPDED